MILKKYYRIDDHTEAEGYVINRYDYETQLRKASFPYSNYSLGSNLPVPWWSPYYATAENAQKMLEYMLAVRDDPTIDAWKSANALYMLENSSNTYTNPYSAYSEDVLSSDTDVDNYVEMLGSIGVLDSTAKEPFRERLRSSVQRTVKKLAFYTQLSDPVQKEFISCTLHILLFPMTVTINGTGNIACAYWECSGKYFPVYTIDHYLNLLRGYIGDIYVFPHLMYTFSLVYEQPCLMFDMGIYCRYAGMTTITGYTETYTRTLLGVTPAETAYSPTLRQYSDREEIRAAGFEYRDFWECPAYQTTPGTGTELAKTSYRFGVNDPAYGLEL